jgi:hypothetical protein
VTRELRRGKDAESGKIFRRIDFTMSSSTSIAAIDRWLWHRERAIAKRLRDPVSLGEAAGGESLRLLVEIIFDATN